MAALHSPAAASVKPPSLGARFLDSDIWVSFRRSNLTMLAALLTALFLLAALLAGVLSPQNPFDPAQLDLLNSRITPIWDSTGQAPFLLGTDQQGRDMLSAILYGTRISLAVGIASVVIACAVGASVGVLAAYAGGRVETLVMRFVDLQLSFPAILVALVLLAVFGRGVDKVVIALVLVQWAYYARTVRGSALVEKRREYIEAARCLALPKARIVFRHLLPNCLPPLIVVATVQVAHAIALEATLSFLGVGVPITEPSLGALIYKGYNYLLSGKYWISTFPGVALVVVIVAINLVGDRLRDVLNPRLSK